MRSKINEFWRKVKEVNKNKIPEYQIFNSKFHNTETEYYWVSALCLNCIESTQVAIPRKEKLNDIGFKGLICPKCGSEKSLHHAVWDGKKYVRVETQ